MYFVVQFLVPSVYSVFLLVVAYFEAMKDYDT